MRSLAERHQNKEVINRIQKEKEFEDSQSSRVLGG
jgi:hypothetical protein